MEVLGNYIGMMFLIIQFIVLVYVVRKQKGYGMSIGVAITSVVGNIGLFKYYNGLKGEGKAPGLTYFGKTCLQFGFIALAGILLLVLLLVIVIVKKRNKNSYISCP